MHRYSSTTMKLIRPVLFTLFFALTVSVISAAPHAVYKLSSDGPLPIGGDVSDFATSNDGNYVVYRAGQDIAELRQLYSVPTDHSAGPAPVSALPDRRRTIQEYIISSDNAHVVYNADQDEEDLYELYSTPLDGSAPPLKLSAEMVEDGGLRDNRGSFKISPDGSWVVYRAQQDTDEVYELYGVPIDGSAPPIKLNGELTDGGAAWSYEISPDGQYLLYTADQDTDTVIELYRVPLDGSGPAVKIEGALPRSSFKISPDSTYVVYQGEQDTPGLTELYMVPLDGSALPIKLNGTLAPGGYAAFGGTYYISPDSQRVVYLADQDTKNIYELHSVPITGGMDVKLNAPLPPGGEVSWVWDPQISSDSSRVVYLADQETGGLEEIFSVPIAGGASVKLNGPLAGTFLYDFAVSPDSSRVVYRARQDDADHYELYSVPLAGGASQKLNDTLDPGGQVNSFRISPDNSRVVYMADKGMSAGYEIYRVPLAGGDVTKVNGPITEGGRVRRYEIAPDSSRVVYIADQDMVTVEELYQAPLDPPGPVSRLNDTLAVGADIWSYETTGDSEFVLYIADHTRHFRNDLYRVRLDGSDDPLRLSQAIAGDFTMYDLEIAHGDVWALITANETGEPNKLYSVPINGIDPPVQLNTTAVPNARLHYFRLSEDGQYVVYRAEEDTAGVFEIYSALVDGSGEQKKLNGALVAGGEVEGFQISPTGSRVVYTADQEMEDVVELYTVPIGGGTAVKLSKPLLPDREIRNNSFSISPNGAWVGYIADHDSNDVFELYIVPSDGSAQPVKVNAPLGADRRVSWFEFNPNGGSLVYRADQAVDEQYELYRVSLPGPGAPQKVNATLGPGRSVDWFDFSPDGAYLLYGVGAGTVPTTTDGESLGRTAPAARGETGEQNDIYTVSMLGGGTVDLIHSLPPDYYVDDYRLSADGRYLIYTVFSEFGPDAAASPNAAAEEPGVLYSAQVNGSGKPRQVNEPVAPGSYISFQIFNGSDGLIYAAATGAGYTELYSTAIDGRGSVEKFNIPLVEDGVIQRFRISPDDSRVVYQADQDTVEVEELYATTIPEVHYALYLPATLRQ